jgi:hypothetical protein
VVEQVKTIRLRESSTDLVRSATEPEGKMTVFTVEKGGKRNESYRARLGSAVAESDALQA